MGRRKISTNETRVQVPLKNPVYKKLEADAGDEPLGRRAAKIISGHYAPRRKNNIRKGDSI